MKKADTLKRIICLLICCSIIVALTGAFEINALAAKPPLLTLAQAQKLAVTNSADIKKKFNDIIMKKTKYVEAVKGIRAKVKNLTSFRWTPLLTFKFPEKLNLIEEYDLNTKPLVLQAEITTMQHALNDLRFKAINEASKAFLKVFVLQEKISFTGERLAQAEATLAKNRARLVTGDAKEADIEKMEKTVESLTTELSNLKRNFESAKNELSDIIGIPITSDCRFSNPMRVANIPRDDLEAITKHTLENDQTYYEAKMATSTALLNLNSYVNLMKSQYGSKMNSIMPYVNMVKQGVEIDFTAFKLKYDEMLKTLDQPWVGNIWILFFKIPKEWFKGEISGTRYIEDEMYAVYTACQEYSSARKDMLKAEQALIKEINSAYEALITARNSYFSLVDQLKSTEKDLEKITILNRLGKAEYSELKDIQGSFEEMQIETVDALAFYSELLFDFDRLTCGAVTKYLKGEGIATEAAKGGDSYADVDPIDKPYYYIYNGVEDMVFVFGVNIPENFEPEVTDYEIWYEGTMLGSRTKIDKHIRHLTLDYGSGSLMTVRFFNEDKFVDECEVDTSVPRDVLNLKGATLTPPPTEFAVGTYTVGTTTRGKLSTSAITLKPDPGYTIKFYKLSYKEGSNIYSSELTPIEKEFTYLTLLIKSLASVTLTLYDENQEKLYTARFDTTAQKIMAIAE